MKIAITVLATIVCGSVFAQHAPTEIKKETEIKSIAFKEGAKISEGKMKIVTKESSNVVLDEKDAFKVNQDRVPATRKIEKTVMIDNDQDTAYDIKTKETFYINEGDTYRFSSSATGFDMAYSDDEDAFIKVGKAWNTNTSGIYIIKAEGHDGIGYFKPNGDFTIEHYDDTSGTIKATTYKSQDTAL